VFIERLRWRYLAPSFEAIECESDALAESAV